MAEILTYSQSLTSLTGGRGDYHMHFLRYEEVPTHIAQKLIEEAKKEQEDASALVSQPERTCGSRATIPRRRLRRDVQAAHQASRGGNRLWNGAARVRSCASRARASAGSARSASGRSSSGERASASRPTGESYVDVCPLCQEIAIENGWIKEGSPTTPTVPAAPRAGARLSLVGALRPAPHGAEATGRARADPAPAVRARAGDGRGGRPLQRERLPAHDRRHREEPRRAEGVRSCRSRASTARSWSRSPGRSPGTSTASPPDSAQPVRLAERGHELGELEATFTEWNAQPRRGGRARARHRTGLASAWLSTGHDSYNQRQDDLLRHPAASSRPSCTTGWSSTTRTTRT